MDQRVETKTFEYDEKGFLTKSTWASNGVTKVEEWDYDEAGRTTKHTVTTTS